jgi:sulfur carrier protein
MGVRLTVAGQTKEYDAGLTVSELIRLEQVETPEYVTVSVNDEFAPSGSFETTVLHDGDSVEFLYFMGGGVPDNR